MRQRACMLMLFHLAHQNEFFSSYKLPHILPTVAFSGPRPIWLLEDCGIEQLIQRLSSPNAVGADTAPGSSRHEQQQGEGSRAVGLPEGPDHAQATAAGAAGCAFGAEQVRMPFFFHTPVQDAYTRCIKLYSWLYRLIMVFSQSGQQY